MTYLLYTLATLFFLLTPAVVVWLCRRLSLLRKIGPIMVLYAIGIVVANLPFHSSEFSAVATLLPNVMVPLAIPMMLLGCEFRRDIVGTQLRVVVSGFLSVAVAVVVGYWLFGKGLKEGAEVGGIISGMYTGGTINAAALQTILRTESSIFALINSYDIIISLLYFVFLFTFGIRLFRWLYGPKGATTSTASVEGIDTSDVVEDQSINPYEGLFRREGLKEVAKIFGVAVVIVALSGVVALPCSERWFMVVFILMITTLGVGASFIRRVRELRRSYDIGLYLIYIFSLAIASMADFSTLDLRSGLNLIGFMSFAVFVSLLLHALVCRLLRVDADSMVISSVSFINSPPFVPMVAGVMKNRDAMVTGLSAGIIGYALGNHFGVLMAELLHLLA